MRERIIYKNKDEAERALGLFCRSVYHLEKAFGVEQDTDDCCLNTYWVARYYDEDGIVREVRE